MHIFDKPLPVVVSSEQIQANNKVFSVDFVHQFAESTGNVQAGLRWFETFALQSEFYQLVAKPLLSIGTVVSMSVERRVKPLKHSILKKDRNRLLDPKGICLFRASENLRHIMAAKKMLGKGIVESLN